MGLFSSLFGGKSNEKQVKAADETRRRAGELLTDAKSALMSAGIKTNIQKDKLDGYALRVAALESYLDKTPVLRLETADIDAEIKKSATIFSTSIKEDQATAAEKGFIALRWGILEGRKDIDAVEAQNMREIVDNRLKIMNAYIAMQESASEADKCRARLIKLNAERDKLAAEVASYNDYLKSDENAVTLNLIKGKKLLNPQFTGDTEEEKMYIALETKLSVSKNGLAAAEKDIRTTELALVNAESATNTQEIAIEKLCVEHNWDLSRRMKEISEDLTEAISKENEWLQNLITDTNRITSIMLETEDPPALKLQIAMAHQDFLDGMKQDAENELARVEAEQKAEAMKQKLEEERLQRENQQKTVITN